MGEEKKLYVDIFFVDSEMNSFTLDELTQIYTDIKKIQAFPPGTQPGFNNKDVFKFSNRDSYDNIFLRIHVKYSSKGDAYSDPVFKYEAELWALSSPSSRSRTILGQKTYTSAELSKLELTISNDS